MNRWRFTSPILLASLAVGAEAAVLLSVASPLRVVVALLFVLVAPGWAALRLLHVPMGVLASVVTAVGVSVSVDILLSLALFYARLWSIQLAMTILLVVVIVLGLADLPVVRRALRRRAPSAKMQEMTQQ